MMFCQGCGHAKLDLSSPSLLSLDLAFKTIQPIARPSDSARFPRLRALTISCDTSLDSLFEELPALTSLHMWSKVSRVLTAAISQVAGATPPGTCALRRSTRQTLQRCPAAAHCVPSVCPTLIHRMIEDLSLGIGDYNATYRWPAAPFLEMSQTLPNLPSLDDSTCMHT